MNPGIKLLLVCGFVAAGYVPLTGHAQPIEADPSGTIAPPAPAAAPTASSPTPAASGTAATGTAAPGSAPGTSAQAGSAPTTPVTAPATVAAPAQPASPDTTRAAPVSDGVTVPGTEQISAGEDTAATPPADTAALPGVISPQVLAKLQNLDYRKIEAINWPPRFLADREIREKYKDAWAARDVNQFRAIFNDYCLSHAKLYQGTVEREWKLSPGLLSLERACEGLKVMAASATAADSYLFEYPNPLVIHTFDELTYRFYTSPAFKLNEQLNSIDRAAAEEQPAVVSAPPEEDASLFGMFGVPAVFVPFVTELLLLLALMLNGFLIYKVFKK